MSAYNEMDEKTLRKEIAQIYNKVNQEMYKVGVRKQKIEILQDKILVFGEHHRVPALEAIHEKYPELTLTVDTTLIKEFKERLKMELEKELPIKVKTILKDFDPVTEEAAAIIYIAT